MVSNSWRVCTSTDWLGGPVSSLLTAGMLVSVQHVAGLAAEADALVVVVRSTDSKLYESVFYSRWSGAGDNCSTKPKPKLDQCCGSKQHITYFKIKLRGCSFHPVAKPNVDRRKIV